MSGALIKADVANSQDRPRYCAAKVRHKIQRLFPAERFAHNQISDDHACHAGDRGRYRRQKRSIHKRLDATRNSGLIMAEIERIIHPPDSGERADNDRQVQGKIRTIAPYVVRMNGQRIYQPVGRRTDLRALPVTDT